LNVYISQGSAATDLRGGDSFNSSFLHRSFLNLTVKNFENRSTSAEVLPFDVRGSGNYASPCIFPVTRNLPFSHNLTTQCSQHSKPRFSL